MTTNKKYYANKNGIITIQCPACKKSRDISVENFRDRKHTINIKCNCDNIFAIDIEFRKNYRKKTNIWGRYRAASGPIDKSKDCIITNLSLGGIAFKITNDLTIKKNDQLIIKFTLDNKEKSEIERTIKVCHIDLANGIIGGEFLYSKIGSYDKYIYFYLK